MALLMRQRGAGIGRVIFAVLAIAGVAGCARTSVDHVSVRAVGLPKPQLIVVHDFSVSAGDVSLDRAIGARLVQMMRETPASEEELKIGAGFNHRGPRYAVTDARLGPKPIQHPGPPIWMAAMGPRALALTARHADGWEASYLTPESFAARWERLSKQVHAEGRSIDSFRRSVELDAIVTKTGEPPRPGLARFCADRGIARDHPLLETVLAGDGDAIARRMAAYEGAGATDLMLGFTDFPETRMLESFAASVLARQRSL